jgi:hypothetical protein
MTKIEEINERHKKEIEELRSNCKHKSLSDWIEEYWAPGHTTGFQVRVCNECGEIVKRSHIRCECMNKKYYKGDIIPNCLKCRNSGWIVTDEFIDYLKSPFKIDEETTLYFDVNEDNVGYFYFKQELPNANFYSDAYESRSEAIINFKLDKINWHVG